jgi:hypothetical protein
MNIKFLLVILIVTGCAPASRLEVYTEIDTSCDLCIVCGELNGKKTYFLLDTGASLTTLDINQSKFFGFSSKNTDIEIGGFTNSTGTIEQAIGITSISINGTDVKGDFIYTNNMNNLVRFVEACSKKKISGIIGVPIIKDHGLIIDLTNKTLYRFARQSNNPSSFNP